MIKSDLIRAALAYRKKLARKFCWEQNARSEQRLPEGNWRIWLILAGRGFGKTRTGAETIRSWVDSGKYKRIALIGDNMLNARQVMIEGESGLLSCYPQKEAPKFLKSKNQLIWKNGAIATLFSAGAHENLRGPQFDAAWIDEFAKFKRIQEVWDQLSFGLRLGKHPKCIITTTPKPLPFLKKIIERSDCVVTYGSTFQNEKNLSADFINHMKEEYADKRIGLQELFGKIIDSCEGALWKAEWFRYFDESLVFTY